MVALLCRLNEQGHLEGFLERAEGYWMDINIFQLALQEQQGGGRAVLSTVRKDWPRLWPQELEAERMSAFDSFTDFWKRLDRSKLMDSVMQEVLPDSEKVYDDLMESSDQQKLAKMSDEERRDEIMRRLGSADIIKQFAILSQNDPEVASIGSKMTPFIAKFVATLERKIATQTESLGKTIDYGLIAIGVAVVLVILFATGVVKLP